MVVQLQRMENNSSCAPLGDKTKTSNEGKIMHEKIDIEDFFLPI